jgi:hypothetical protein
VADTGAPTVPEVKAIPNDVSKLATAYWQPATGSSFAVNLNSHSTTYSGRTCDLYNVVADTTNSRKKGFDYPTILTPAERRETTSDDDAPVILHVEYHPRQIERLSIQRVFGELCAGPFRDTANKENKPTGIKRLIIAYSRPPNLRDLLCRTKMEQRVNEHVSDHINKIRLALDNAGTNYF